MDVPTQHKDSVLAGKPPAPPPQKEIGNSEDASSVKAQQPEVTTDLSIIPSERTKGEWVFDAFLYPFLNNIAVFAISVAATYLTSHGDKIGGGMGRWFYRRGEWFKGKAQKAGLSEGQADMAKMVAFSFIDGSIMAPFVKLFEDRRNKIARALDMAMGTVPEDQSVYDKEPRQTWTSVLLGRLATCLIVVPTAVALDKVKINKVALNDWMFTRPGKRMGDWFVRKYPHIQEDMPRIHLPEVFKIGTFEAFYTSVCTAGLYFWSRFIARATEDRKHPNHRNGSPKNGDSAAPPHGANGKESLAPKARVLPRQACRHSDGIPKSASHVEQVDERKSLQEHAAPAPGM